MGGGLLGWLTTGPAMSPARIGVGCSGKASGLKGLLIGDFTVGEAVSDTERTAVGLRGTLPG